MILRFTKAFVVVLTLASSLQGAESSGPLRLSATFEPIRIYARPGERVGRNYRIALDKNQRDAFFAVKAMDWWPSEDGQQSFYREGGAISRSCSSWVDLNPVEAKVEAGGTLDVMVSVSVPDDVEAGGYWCSVTIDERPNPVLAPTNVSVRFLTSVSVGVFVFIEPVQRAADITGVDIGPERALINLFNRGNAPVWAEGRIEFRSPDGNSVVAVSRIHRRTVVLDPVRDISLNVPLPSRDVLPSGDYLVRVVLDIGLDSFIGVQKVMEVNREGALAAGTR